jgi:hypothetical protein
MLSKFEKARRLSIVYWTELLYYEGNWNLKLTKNIDGFCDIYGVEWSKERDTYWLKQCCQCPIKLIDHESCSETFQIYRLLSNVCELQNIAARSNNFDKKHTFAMAMLMWLTSDDFIEGANPINDTISLPRSRRDRWVG